LAEKHVAMMRYGRWLAKGLNKLARTYAAQMQTVMAQHVNVEGSGKAIVGNVSTVGWVEHEK
jgi:hypothetical protein